MKKKEERQIQFDERAEEILKDIMKTQDEINGKSPDLYRDSMYYMEVTNSMLIRRIAELEIKFEKHYHLGRTNTETMY